MATRTFTSANQITILRLVFVPLFAILEISERFGWALAVLAAAALTDAVDGLVARLFRQQTPLGMALDPIADKLLMATGYVVLAVRDALPWWLTILVLSRDVAIIVTSLLISLVVGYRRFRPTLLGKVSTALQVTTLLAGVSSQVHAPYVSRWMVDLSIYATAALTLASGIHYLIIAQHRYERHPGEAASGSETADSKN